MATVLQVECDISPVVRGGVDCGRRWWNVYDKKPQHYAKDNRMAHLTACRFKSVAYVTNNKRLYSAFCTVEANYWQTWSIVRPLCDSRATCLVFVIIRLIQISAKFFPQCFFQIADWGSTPHYHVKIIICHYLTATVRHMHFVYCCWLHAADKLSNSGTDQQMFTVTC